MPPKKNNTNVEEDEPRDNSPCRISFRDLEKSMTSFSGDDTYPLLTWFEEFEDMALLMKWSEIEKLIYAKQLLSGTAKLFLRTLGSVKDYKKLKSELQEEFGSKLNSAVIHKKLSSRKMNKDETYQQYFLHMKEMALHGEVEEAALMEYVIDGIQDCEFNKSVLYGASDIKEFRKKLDIYKSIKDKIQSRPSTSTPFTKNTDMTLLAEEKSTISEERYAENKELENKIEKMIDDYKPDDEKTESKVEMKIILTEEDLIDKSPRRLSPQDIKVVDGKIKERSKEKIVRPSKLDEEIIKSIEEEGIANYNEKRNKLKRLKTNKKIQDENIKNYKRKRKRATEYKVGNLVALNIEDT